MRLLALDRVGAAGLGFAEWRGEHSMRAKSQTPCRSKTCIRLWAIHLMHGAVCAMLACNNHATAWREDGECRGPNTGVFC